jgi:putative FmdB family regulatory protein
MPIYEFYCADCHTLFNFFSSGIDTKSRPLCPRCKKVRLERRPATFATLKHKGEEEPSPFDEERLEGAMESILGDIDDSADEEDPQQLARLFRRFGEAAGLDPGPRMEEILARLEAGEDPDRLEEEFGEVFEEEGDEDAMEEFFRFKKAAASGRYRRPRVDPELYFL